MRQLIEKIPVLKNRSGKVSVVPRYGVGLSKCLLAELCPGMDDIVRPGKVAVLPRRVLIAPITVHYPSRGQLSA